MTLTPRLAPMVVLAVLSGLVALGCADGLATKPAEETLELVECTEPRPEMCPMHYEPVCGYQCDGPPCDAGSRKTYSNGCGACSDAEVRSWSDGPCPEG